MFDFSILATTLDDVLPFRRKASDCTKGTNNTHAKSAFVSVTMRYI